jgi:uncharacterized protein YidB (DUF937 family)
LIAELRASGERETSLELSSVGTGPNQPIEPNEVEAAIDEGTLKSLSMQTGLSREELIRRITQDLPRL